jgi:hypothetical protein
MVEKINKNSNRLIETNIVRNGESETVEEFWSSKSLRKRPITEQYPKLKGEEDKDYKDRIQKIQESIESRTKDELSEEDKREIEAGAYNRESGRSASLNYRKFGKNILKVFDMLENAPELLYGDKDKKSDSDRQKEQEKKAQFYIDLLQKEQPAIDKFSGLVPDNDLARDRASATKKENENRIKSMQKSPAQFLIDERIKKWEQAAEAILYPLTLNFGLFDNNAIATGDGATVQRRARAIFPSEYDDLFHGVDAAFMIPIGMGEQGETRYLPITFDCSCSSTSQGVERKFSKIKDSGITEIKYAKSESNKLQTGIHSYNFVLGIDHTDIIGKNGLLSEDNITHAPKKLVHDIYVQILAQTVLRGEYYEMLRCKRAKTKDMPFTDVLSKEELLGLRQIRAINAFFRQKCKETATNIESPFTLSRFYGEDNTVALVIKEVNKRISDQRDYIAKIKKQNGWK